MKRRYRRRQVVMHTSIHQEAFLNTAQDESRTLANSVGETEPLSFT